MTCGACGEKPTHTTKDFTKAVIEIDNPEQIALLRKVSIPASMGDETNVPPAVGKYRNVILHYEANKHTYLYSSDGIPTLLEVEVSPEIIARVEALENDTDVLGHEVDGIEAKIPNAASAQNQLADKNFVNSSIATNTANYISNNGEPFTSVAQLEAYSGTVSNNDYAFVTGTDSSGNTYYDRYKATVTETPVTVTWAKEYRLNNSSFTSDQWAAINSGITSNGVEKLTGLANIKTIGANLTLDADGELSGTGGPSGIPTSAKFWGVSYDSINDKVDGAIESVANGPQGSDYSIIDFKPDNGVHGFGAAVSNYQYHNSGAISLRLLGRGTTSDPWSIEKTISFDKTALSVGGLRISTVSAPVNAQDAATKNYVDTAIAGTETQPYSYGNMITYTTTNDGNEHDLQTYTATEAGLYQIFCDGWIYENWATLTANVYPCVRIKKNGTEVCKTQEQILNDGDMTEQRDMDVQCLLSLSIGDVVTIVFQQNNSSAADMKFEYSWGIVKVSN